MNPLVVPQRLHRISGLLVGYHIVDNWIRDNSDGPRFTAYGGVLLMRSSCLAGEYCSWVRPSPTRESWHPSPGMAAAGEGASDVCGPSGEHSVPDLLPLCRAPARRP
jgi:hypothetical protein